jgi:hypothetical protein
MQKGLLAAVDPLWLLSDAKDAETEWIEWLLKEGEVTEEGKPKYWSLTARIRYLYEIPSPDVKHDHNPANDAYTIAHEYAAIQLIAQGSYSILYLRKMDLNDYTPVKERVMKKRPMPEEEEMDEENGKSGKMAKKGK